MRPLPKKKIEGHESVSMRVSVAQNFVPPSTRSKDTVEKGERDGKCDGKERFTREIPTHMVNRKL